MGFPPSAPLLYVRPHLTFLEHGEVEHMSITRTGVGMGILLALVLNGQSRPCEFG